MSLEFLKVDRNRVLTKKEIDQQFQEVVLGKRLFRKEFYAGEADLVTYGWSNICVQKLTIDKMGRIYGVKIWKLSLHLSFS
jgi:hypothetical protein